MNIAVLHVSAIEDNRDDAGLIEGRLSREGVSFSSLKRQPAGPMCAACLAPRNSRRGRLDRVDLTMRAAA